MPIVRFWFNLFLRASDFEQIVLDLVRSAGKKKTLSSEGKGLNESMTWSFRNVFHQKDTENSFCLHQPHSRDNKICCANKSHCIDFPMEFEFRFYTVIPVASLYELDLSKKWLLLKVLHELKLSLSRTCVTFDWKKIAITIKFLVKCLYFYTHPHYDFGKKLQ